jgi:hypothetical protein
MGAPNIALISFFEGNKQNTNESAGGVVLDILRSYLAGSDALPTCFANNIEDFFALRIEALHWIVENHITIDYDEIGERLALSDLPTFGENKMLQTLQENVSFALRVCKRLLKNMPAEATNALESGNITNHLPSGIGYRQFLALIEVTAPQNAVQEIEKLLSVSLGLEAGLVCVMLLVDENRQVSEAKLIELCKWIADKAQTLGAFFRKLDTKERKTRQTNDFQASDIGFQEDKILAEQGMVEYANSLAI